MCLSTVQAKSIPIDEIVIPPHFPLTTAPLASKKLLSPSKKLPESSKKLPGELVVNRKLLIMLKSNDWHNLCVNSLVTH
uniref:Uncharacterized protein n=1 Tax=Vibrio sp. FF_307 TaxID=1652834 RepID=A0A0H3ZW83_9VIBR|nr:hypothetical protein [Vibrio sp. FF_307]